MVEKKIVREGKKKGLIIVNTGNGKGKTTGNAHPEIVEMADLVTEMREIKHPFKKGITAQKGVEF